MSIQGADKSSRRSSLNYPVQESPNDKSSRRSSLNYSAKDSPNEKSSRRSSLDYSARESQNDESITKDIGRLSLVPTAKKSSFGTLGKQVTTLVNYFELDLTKAPDLYEYQFKVCQRNRPDAQISRRMKTRVAWLLLDRDQRFKFAASNYSNIFISTKRLTLDGKPSETYPVAYFEREEQGPRTGDQELLFDVTLTFSQRFSMQALRARIANQETDYHALEAHTTAINIALARSTAQNPSMVTRREKFFDLSPSSRRSANLGFGLDVVSGFRLSTRLTKTGMVVNLNTIASAMYKEGSLDGLISLLLQTTSFDTAEKRLNYLDAQLSLMQIQTEYRGRKARHTIYKMARCTRRSEKPISANIRFSKDNQPISVEDFFKATYPNAQRNNLQAIVVDVGSADRPVYIPADLCHVLPGNFYKGLLPHASQTTNMIRFACRTPAENQRLILREGLPQMGAGVDGGPADRFQMLVVGKMINCIARILPSAGYHFATGLDVKQVSTGSWNMRGRKFITAPTHDVMRLSWIELLRPGERSAPNLQQFLDGLRRSVQQYTGHQDARVETFPGFGHSLVIPMGFGSSEMTAIWQAFIEKGVRLVFVILPDYSPHNYRSIKLSAITTGHGIHTVCTVRHGGTGKIKDNPDELANLMLKVNAKLGGVNLKLQTPQQLKKLFEKPIMIFGLDVVHPGRAAMKGAPSVAAVAGTYDETFGRYYSTYRLMTPEEGKKSQEFILELGDMVKGQLEMFRQRYRCLPSVIVVYRDGVADNMIAEVVNCEVKQLLQLYKKLYSGEGPKTIFMIATKRGHTRFYQPEKNSPGFDKSGNPMPGFVVDQKITNSKRSDFYLVSHKGLQGTSKPAHYIIVHDDYGATADEIQYLTYTMCFLWPRATKSIGIHPAVRTADRLCDLAKVFLNSAYNPPLLPPGEPKPVYHSTEHWMGDIAPGLRGSPFWL